MAKRATYAELRAQLDEAERGRSVLGQALHCTVTENVDARAVTDRDEYGARYELRLYRATAAHGGILVSLFEHPGQRTSVGAQYFEEAKRERHASWDTAWGRIIAPAMDQLDRARNAMVQNIRKAG